MDDQGQTAIEIAVRLPGRLSGRILQVLLAEKADIKTQPSTNPLLHQAVEHDNAEALRLLLAAKANVNQLGKRQDRPLHLLRHTENVEITRILLEHKADVHQINSKGITPLQAFFLLSCSKDRQALSVPITTLLLTAGALVNACNFDGETVLHSAAKNNYSQAVKLLLTAQADVDLINHKGETALAIACYLGRVAVVEHLLEKKASPNKKNPQGRTPLMLAMSLFNSNKQATLDLLLSSNNAAMNHRDNDGWSVLRHAVETQAEPSVINTLLQAKVDPFSVKGVEIPDEQIRATIEQAQRKSQSIAFSGIFHPRLGARAPVAKVQERGHFERQLPRLIFSLAGSQSKTKSSSAAVGLEQGLKSRAANK